MKKAAVFLLVLCLLCGCDAKNGGMERAMALRTSLISADGYCFTAQITADFGDKTYDFSMDCTFDTEGNMEFCILEPEYLCEVTGTVNAEGGALTFDDTAFAFPLVGDTYLSPVSTPWVMVKVLRGGYVRACSEEGDVCRVTVDDSFAADALTADIRLDNENVPIYADIYEENRKIVSITVKNFRFR